MLLAELYENKQAVSRGERLHIVTCALPCRGISFNYTSSPDSNCFSGSAKCPPPITGILYEQQTTPPSHQQVGSLSEQTQHTVSVQAYTSTGLQLVITQPEQSTMRLKVCMEPHSHGRLHSTLQHKKHCIHAIRGAPYKKRQP